MPIPLATERVVDLIIRSLRASGVLADDVSAQTIREAPNNATDAQLNAIAASLNYGGVSGTDAIFAVEDFDLVIDSDDSISGSGPYYQQFRVERGQSTLPVTDPLKHLMSVGFYRFNVLPPISVGALLTVGPTKQVASGSAYAAAIDIGYDDATSGFNGRLYAGGNAIFPTEPGLRVMSSRDVEISANSQVMFSGSALRAVRGGWPDLVYQERFEVGDYTTDNSIGISRGVDGAGKQYFVFQTTPTDIASGERIFFRSSVAARTNATYVAIGGTPDDPNTDPNNIGYPALSVFSTPNTADSPSLFIWNRSIQMANGVEMITLRSEATPFSSNHYFVRMYRAGSAIFSIDGTFPNPVCNCPGGFVTGPADVAEHMTVNTDQVLPGTVMVIGEDGELHPSDSVADPKVAGVVSKAAGMLLGDKNKYDDSTATKSSFTLAGEDKLTSELFLVEDPGWEVGEILKIGPAGVFYEVTGSEALEKGHKVTLNDKVVMTQDTPVFRGIVKLTTAPIAAVGRVTVRCSGFNGPIHPGTALVSGPNGCAVSGGDSPSPLAVLGKALGAWTNSTGEGTVEALVSW